MTDKDLSYLSELSDNELVAAAQRGDNEAYSAVIGRYIFLVRNCAGGYFSDSLEFDDLVQEGFIGLMNAVKGFDPDCNTAFSTFAKLCIERNIISAVRKTLRKKQIPSSMLVFIDDDSYDKIAPADTANPETAVLNKEAYDRLKEDIFSKLSKTELKVLQAYLSGSSYEQIAAKLNLSVKAVDNAMQRIRKKLH